MCRPNDNNAANATSKDPSDVRKASPSSSSDDRRDHYYPRHFYFTKEKHSHSSHIRPLNDKVESISSRKMKEASSSSSSVTVPPPHVLLHADGALVYPDRWRFLPLVYLLASIILISRCPSYIALFLATIILYFESDLYSGVVHIVLDDPKNLGRSNYVMEAIMFQGCLEFQWHHEIPRDIVVKGVLSSCADLNVLVSANMVAVACAHGMPWRDDHDNRLLWSIMGLKLLYGYFGQYNHLMAHESEIRRPGVVKTLQDELGVMLDRRKHNGHHRTYVDNFCLLGKMDWAIHLIDEHVVPPANVAWRHNVWFGIWMFMSVFCLPCVVTPCVRAAAGWVGAAMG